MPNEEVIPLDKLARVYRKMYTKVQELTKEYESQIEELKAKQDEIKNAMKDQMMALGTNSVRTAEGTIILCSAHEPRPRLQAVAQCAQMKAPSSCHRRRATTQTTGIRSSSLLYSTTH